MCGWETRSIPEGANYFTSHPKYFSMYMEEIYFSGEHVTLCTGGLINSIWSCRQIIMLCLPTELFVNVR